MRQRVAVRAIVKQDDKVFFLKRANGRASILGKYELPGGKLAYSEQPENTLRRYMHDDAGLHMHTAQLFDVVTYIDQDDRDIQYVVIIYNVTLTTDHHTVTLSQNYDKYQWKSIQDVKQSDTTDLTQLLLGILDQGVVAVETAPELVDTNSVSSVTLFSDGGSRGNPGPSAAGYVLVDEAGVVIDQGGEYLGITTNNQAEYQGVRMGLERALELGYRQVHCKIDSMLVVNQMNGVYAIKNRELWPINQRIKDLVVSFDKVRFMHVRREFNQLADGMVNKTLDEHARTQSGRV